MPAFRIWHPPCLAAWVDAADAAGCSADRMALQHRPMQEVISANSFTPELKLGGNVRYGFTDNNILSDLFTQNLLSAGNTLESESNSVNNKSQNFNMDLRLEWEPDSITRVIFRPRVSFYDNRRNETGDFLTVSELEGDTINYGESDYFSEGEGKDISFNLDASRELGKEGRILSVQLRGQTGDSDNSGTSVSGTYYNERVPMI